MSYAYGTVAEHRLIAELRDQGFATMRATASKGEYDIVATRKDKVVFASVKRCHTWKQAGKVYRAERRKLAALELPSSRTIVKLLAIWADKVGDDQQPQRGGLWYCLEEVTAAPTCSSDSGPKSPQPKAAGTGRRLKTVAATDVSDPSPD